MDICFEVLDHSKDALINSEMDIERRSDPVYVSRMITAMVMTSFYSQYKRGNTQTQYNISF